MLFNNTDINIVIIKKPNNIIPTVPLRRKTESIVSTTTKPIEITIMLFIIEFSAYIKIIIKIVVAAITVNRMIVSMLLYTKNYNMGKNLSIIVIRSAVAAIAEITVNIIIELIYLTDITIYPSIDKIPLNNRIDITINFKKSGTGNPLKNMKAAASKSITP